MSACPRCNGKGGMGTFGPVCAGDTFYQRPCPFCKGACRIAAPQATKCLKCGGLGGEGTFGPCEVGDVHFKKNCELCLGDGYFLGNWTFNACTMCAAKGARTSSGTPCEMGSIHFNAVCPVCFGKGFNKQPAGGSPISYVPNPTPIGMPGGISININANSLPGPIHASPFVNMNSSLPPGHPMTVYPRPSPDVAMAFGLSSMGLPGPVNPVPGPIHVSPVVHIHPGPLPGQVNPVSPIIMSPPSPIIVGPPPMGMGGGAVVVGGFSAVGGGPGLHIGGPGLHIHLDGDMGHHHHHNGGFRHGHHGHRHGHHGGHGHRAGFGFQTH